MFTPFTARYGGGRILHAATLEWILAMLVRSVLWASVVVLSLQGASPAAAQQICDRGHEFTAQENYPRALVELSFCLAALSMDDVERALVYTERARVLYHTGFFEHALADQSAAIDLTPSDSMAWFRRARISQALGEFAGALDDLEKAIELDPENISAYNQRGLLLSDIGEIDAALADYDRAIALAPDDAAFWNNRGFAQMDHGQYERAIVDLSKALELDPSHWLALQNRSRALLGLHRLSDAIADASSCLELNPSAQRCYLVRAEAYSELDLQDRALLDIDKVAEIDPDRVDMLKLRGLVQLRRGDFDFALRDFEAAMASTIEPCACGASIAEDLLFAGGRPDAALPFALSAVETEPDNAVAHYVLGNVYTALHREDDAIAAFETYFQLGGVDAIVEQQQLLASLGLYGGPAEGNYTPELRDALISCVREECLSQFMERSARLVAPDGDPEANSNPDCRQGQSYMNVNRYDAAKKSFDTCIEHGGLQGKALGYAHFLRAMAYRWTNELKLAVTDLDRAIELAPDEAVLFRERATMQGMQGNFGAAVTDLGIALTLEPASIDVLMERSTLLRWLGQMEQALVDAEQALALDPDNATARYRRAVILMDLERYEEALQELDILISHYPGMPYPYAARAWLRFLRAEELEDALHDVATARSKLGDVDWSLLDIQAHVFAALGREEEAIVSFEDVISMVGPLLVVEYQKGLVHQGYLSEVGDGTYDTATREALYACIRDACTVWVERHF